MFWWWLLRIIIYTHIYIYMCVYASLYRDVESSANRNGFTDKRIGCICTSPSICEAEVSKSQQISVVFSEFFFVCYRSLLQHQPFRFNMQAKIYIRSIYKYSHSTYPFMIFRSVSDCRRCAGRRRRSRRSHGWFVSVSRSRMNESTHLLCFVCVCVCVC